MIQIQAAQPSSLDNIAAVDVSQSRILAFWRMARELRFYGAPNSLIRMQNDACTNFYSNRVKILHHRYIGYAPRREIENLFYPGSFAPRERLNRNGRRSLRRGAGPGASGLFVGRPWDHVCVVPYWNSACAISAFAFFDAEESDPTDIVIRQVGQPRKPIREGGFAMLPAASCDLPGSRPDRTIFILLDPIQALKIQFRVVRDSLFPLRIVAVQDDDRFETKAAWGALPSLDDAPRVVVSDTPDARVFRVARAAKASVLIKTDIFDRLQNNVGIQRHLLQLYKRGARNWQSEFQREIVRRSPDAAVDFLSQMRLKAGEATNFSHRALPYTWEHLWRAKPHDILTPRVNVQGKVVIEREHGWFIEATGRPVCDPVRVTRILHRIDGTTLICGEATVDGVKRDFTVLHDQRKGLLKSVAEALALRGITFNFQARWSKCSLSVARQMHKPETVKHADLVGWHDGLFRFPSFTIAPCVSVHAGDDTTVWVDEHTAASSLKPPRRLSRQELRPIALDTPEANLFWAILITAARSILAPAFLSPPVGIALLGVEAKMIAEAAASAWGCRKIALGKRVGVGDMKKVSELLNNTRWPIVVVPPNEQPRMNKRILQRVLPSSCLLPVGAASVCQATNAGWLAVQTSLADTARTSELLNDFGAAVLLNYLSDMIAPGSKFRMSTDQGTQEIWTSLANWFGAQGRGRPAVLGAERCLNSPPQSWEKQQKHPGKSEGGE